jgi:hypothetical protein
MNNKDDNSEKHRKKEENNTTHDTDDYPIVSTETCPSVNGT